MKIARERYPEPMFSNRADLEAVASDPDAEYEICQASMIWKMKRETQRS